MERTHETDVSGVQCGVQSGMSTQDRRVASGSEWTVVKSGRRFNHLAKLRIINTIVISKIGILHLYIHLTATIHNLLLEKYGISLCTFYTRLCREYLIIRTFLIFEDEGKYRQDIKLHVSLYEVACDLCDVFAE